MSIHFPRPKEVKILYDPRLGTHDRPLPTVSVSSGSVIYPQGWGAKTTAPNGAQPSVGVMVNGIEISNPGTPSLDPDANIPFVRIPHNPDIRQVISGNEGFWYNNPCCYTVPITKA